MFTNVVELQVPNGWEAHVTDGLLLLLGLDDGLHGVWLESGTYIGDRAIDFAGIKTPTVLLHTYVWGSHALHPSLCATAILISSPDSRSPNDVIGGAVASLLSVAMMLPTVWLCRYQWRHATRPLLHVAQLPICPMLFGSGVARNLN